MRVIKDKTHDNNFLHLRVKLLDFFGLWGDLREDFFDGSVGGGLENYYLIELFMILGFANFNQVELDFFSIN